jgi:hypothetical protein
MAQEAENPCNRHHGKDLCLPLRSMLVPAAEHRFADLPLPSGSGHSMSKERTPERAVHA